MDLLSQQFNNGNGNEQCGGVVVNSVTCSSWSMNTNTGNNMQVMQGMQQQMQQQQYPFRYDNEYQNGG